MGISSIIILIVAIGSWFLLRHISKHASIEVLTAFSGSPSPKIPTSITCDIPRRRVKNRLGEKTIDLSNFEQMIIKGNSLGCFGIVDNSVVYVKTYKQPPVNITTNEIAGRFIILNIDNLRTVAEHPLELDYFHSEGKKARKALRMVSIKMSHKELENLAEQILKDIPENADKAKLKKEIISKYEFASQYYADKDKELIMSLTYRKDGKNLGFSFHSPRFLYGIVEYVSNNNNSPFYETA